MPLRENGFCNETMYYDNYGYEFRSDNAGYFDDTWNVIFCFWDSNLWLRCVFWLLFILMSGYLVIYGCYEVVRYTIKHYKKSQKYALIPILPLKTVDVESDNNSLIYSLHSCQHTHTLDTQSKNFLYIQKLIDETWLYNERLGKDATALSHSKLNVTGVIQIDNLKLWEMYNRKLESMHIAEPPAEIQSKPILTTTIETSVSEDNSDTNSVETQQNPSEQENVLDKGTAAVNRSANGYSCGELRTNEMHLFHGTRLENIKGIVENGFDLDKAKMGLYGKAIYLAESSEKADQYSDLSTKRRKTQLAMLVVRVIQGRMYCHDKEGAVSMPCNEEIDTVVAGYKKRFREFLVFDAKQCYPEFVVLFDRE